MLNKILVSLGFVGVSIGFFGNTHAAVVGACTLSAVTITTITTTAAPVTALYGPPAPPIASTTCVAVSGSPEAGGLLPDNNRGEAGDGLLNGEVPQNPATQVTFNPTLLVDPSKYLDLDGNGTYTDPGWIRLGGYDQNQNTNVWEVNYEDVTNASGVTKMVSEFLTLSFSGEGGTGGTWRLSVKDGAVQAVQDFLGRSTFDHLALVVKASNEFVVYDFDFSLLAQGLASFNFLTAYTFDGTWSTTDITNSRNVPQGLSHISIWARDPVATLTNDVPEPGVLALMGVALAGLGWARRRSA